MKKFLGYGKYIAEAYWSLDDEQKIAVDGFGDDLPIPPKFFHGDGGEFQVIIDFTAKINYCYSSWQSPEESDEERKLEKAYLMLDGKCVELPNKVQEELFEHFFSEILETEVWDVH